MTPIRIALVLVATASTLVLAQTPAPIPMSTDLAFEVASVKPNNSGSTSSSTSGRQGSFTANNVTLRGLIIFAYRLREFQLTTGPGWITSERYDILARAPENVRTDNPAMVRTLLRDRFKLVAHQETRQDQIYALAMARSDRKFGPLIKPSTLNCASAQCGINTLSGRMVGTGQSMTQLVAALGSFAVRRSVLDRTALTGRYDFDLQWTPDTSVGSGTANDAPSIFAALQEQLGLKLETGRGPVDFLVIDSIERPAPD